MDEEKYREYIRSLTQEELDEEVRKLEEEKKEFDLQKRIGFLMVNKYANQIVDVLNSGNENRLYALLAKMEADGIPRSHSIDIIHGLVTNVQDA